MDMGTTYSHPVGLQPGMFPTETVPPPAESARWNLVTVGPQHRTVRTDADSPQASVATVNRCAEFARDADARTRPDPIGVHRSCAHRAHGVGRTDPGLEPPDQNHETSRSRVPSFACRRGVGGRGYMPDGRLAPPARVAAGPRPRPRPPDRRGRCGPRALRGRGEHYPLRGHGLPVGPLRRGDPVPPPGP